MEALERLFYSSGAASGGDEEDRADGDWGEDDWDNPDIIRSLPMFQVQWAFLPGTQDVLHIFVPHYVHMFETIVRGEKPWYYGHALLEGGSKGDQAAAAKTSVLAEVLELERTKDGRMLLHTRAIGRVQTMGRVQESPYTTCNVVIYDDAEWVATGLAEGEAAAEVVARAEKELLDAEGEKLRTIARHADQTKWSTGVTPGQTDPEAEDGAAKNDGGSEEGGGEEDVEANGGAGSEEGGAVEEVVAPAWEPATSEMEGKEVGEIMNALVELEAATWTEYDRMRSFMGALRLDETVQTTPPAIEALRPPSGDDGPGDVFGTLVRTHRTSYILAASEIPEVSRSDGRQELLEAPGTYERLGLVLRQLAERNAALTARVAVVRALRETGGQED